MGPFINDHGDCQVPIEFEVSQILQTDSEVLLTDSNLTWNSTDSLTFNSRTKEAVAYCYLHFIGKLTAKGDLGQIFLVNKYAKCFVII